MGRRRWRRCSSGEGGEARVRGAGAEAEDGSDGDSSSSPSGRLRWPVVDLLVHRYRLPLHDLSKEGPVVIPWGGEGRHRGAAATWAEEGRAEEEEHGMAGGGRAAAAYRRI